MDGRKYNRGCGPIINNDLTKTPDIRLTFRYFKKIKSSDRFSAYVYLSLLLLYLKTLFLDVCS